MEPLQLTVSALCLCFPFRRSHDLTRKGVIPGGSTFVLNIPMGSQTFTWITDIAAGTELILFMTDANDNQGGNTDIMRVAQSSNASCLDTHAPASLPNPPSLTSSSTSSQTSNVLSSSSTSPPHPTSSATPHGKMDALVPAIVAPVVGVAVLAVGLSIWWCCHRRRTRERDVRVFERYQADIDLTKGNPFPSPHMSDISAPASAVPLLHDRSPSADGRTNHDHYSPPLSISTPQGYHPGARPPYEHSRNSSQHGGAPGLATVQTNSISRAIRPNGGSGPRRKAADAGILAPRGQHPSTQFILHTDLEDSVAPPVNEVIELPPRYSERRPTPRTV